MRKLIYLLFILCFSNTLLSQNNVGIGTITPDASALLDVNASNKGILAPRVFLTNVTIPAPVSAPATGLLIWNTNSAVTGGSGIGFYYWDVTQWQKLSTGSGGWALTGNSGTNQNVNFIGTTDNQPLNFRVNNIPAGKIDFNLYNVFLGVKAGFNTNPTDISNARYNTFIGDSAGYSNTTGSYNSFVGKEAGFSNTTAIANSFFGFQAGKSNTTGQPNSFFGYLTGRDNTTGNVNSFFGYFAGQGNRTGNENSFFGASAGRGDITNGSSGNQNSAFGRLSGQFLTTGSDNSFFGAHSGNQNTTGGQNTFVGDSAGFNNTTASQNTFLGKDAGLANTVGEQNTFMGFQSGASNLFGAWNTSVGTFAGWQNNNCCNAFIGWGAGAFNLGGSNSFLGINAGYGSSGTSFGWYNAALGSYSGFQLVNGISNSFVGAYSGYLTTNGSYNVFVGDSAGYANGLGNNNTMLGYQANLSAGNLNNATAIGNKAFVSGNNNMVLGSINGVNGATADTKVGIGTTAPTNKLHVVLNDPGGAPAAVLLENIGGPSVGEATLALKNIATGDSSWMIGLNETNHLSFAIGTQLVGGTTKMFLNANGNLGLGTTSPSEKLDVIGNIRSSGNVNVTGDVTRPSTGSANLIPICYGHVSAVGLIDNGTGNFTVAHPSTGSYTITITGESYSFISYGTIVTPVGLSPLMTSTFSSGSSLTVRIFNSSGTPTDSNFNFVVYKP
jgi:hypothetical protein